MVDKAVPEKKSKDVEEASNEKFNFYIRKWMKSTLHSDIPTLPSSLPSFSPVCTILESKIIPRRSPRTFESQNFCFSSAPWTSYCIAPSPTSESGTGTGIIYSETMEAHRPPNSNEFELPARTEKTMEHLQAVGLLDCCVKIKPRKAKTKELRLVHTQRHIDYVDQISFFSSLEGATSTSVDLDLYCSERTSEATRMASGCVNEAAKAVVRKQVKNAYAIVRPPGHHASAEMASGFCFYNNVAVAARTAQEELLLLYPEKYSPSRKARVLILDWDVHHCNGTESIFLEDPSVLVISIHQYGHRRGHVLRKRSSKKNISSADGQKSSVNELNVNELEQLFVNDSDPLLLVQKSEQEEENSARLSVAPIPQNETIVKGEFDLLPRSKRARKEVDYEKLADQLGVNDAIAADVFGIPNSPEVSSSSSTTSDSVGEPRPEFNEGTHRRSEDSDGFSQEEAEEGADSQELFYPGTGHIKDIGGEINENARGKNINVACPTVGMGDLEYLQVIHEVVVPCGREFQPDIVFISCGFDSARGDLLGSMNLSCTGYYAMTRIMAKEFGAVVVVLEGGYRVSNVARCSEAVLRALLETSGTPIPQKSKMLWFQMKEVIETVKNEHHPHWKCFSD